MATVCFDARGHGASDGPMGGQPIDDVVAITALLRDRLGDPRTPVALRGSSMGGYLAILGAAPARAGAVVAICPASAAGLRRGLAAGRFAFAADNEALDAFLADHELEPAVAALRAPLLLLHAEGVEQVPIQHSRELAELATVPGSRLIAVPGGHHRSIQHDPELQAVSLRFIEQALGLRPRPGERRD
jgi:pimeloyl-ACP methyl ester carboxylesterase